MKTWQLVDELKSDDERFRQTSYTEFRCDRCNGEIKSFPIYHFDIPNKFNSIDFCMKCFEAPFEFIVEQHQHARFSQKCQFCRVELDVIPRIVKIKGSGIRAFICDDCVLEPEKNMRDYAICITEEFAWSERRRPILLNLSNVNRIEPKLSFGGLTEPRSEVWISLMEDIVALPTNFGSLKQWNIFTDEFFVDTNSVYMLVDCGAETFGRIAAIVSDEYCRAHLYILFDSIQKFEEHFERWRTCKNRNSEGVQKKIKRLLIRQPPETVLRSFAGFFILKQQE